MKAEADRRRWAKLKCDPIRLAKRYANQRRRYRMRNAQLIAAEMMTIQQRSKS